MLPSLLKIPVTGGAGEMVRWAKHLLLLQALSPLSRRPAFGFQHPHQADSSQPRVTSSWELNVFWSLEAPSHMCVEHTHTY